MPCIRLLVKLGSLGNEGKVEPTYGNSSGYILNGPLFGGGPLLGGSVIGGSTVCGQEWDNIPLLYILKFN